MNKENGKSLVLMILIILSIWQTNKLWLGNMSSLSFFAHSKGNGLEAIEPESIWINPGSPVTFIYRLGEENREYQSVRDEVEKNIKTYLDEGVAQKVETLDWKEILTKKGILYEYPISVTYSEMIGSNDKQPPKNFSMVDEIDYIFMQLSDKERGIGKWYLISSKMNQSCLVEVQGQFKNMKTFNDLLNEESLSYKIKYQPTFAMGGISAQNIFLPIVSKDAPLPYEVLRWHNPLNDEGDENKFNPYINHYFLNPLLKKQEITEDGVHIFSELMRTVVKYDPRGVFEYSNIGRTDSKQKISRLEAYNIAKGFLKQNESIPKETRKKLFLTEVEEMGVSYTFYFDMRVGGISVHLSKQEREDLGMDHMAQITVKGSGISKFKWNISELQPKTEGESPSNSQFTEKYIDGLNKVLEYVASQEKVSTLAIEDMKWVYMLSEGEEVHVRWIVCHEGEWYSP